MNSRTKITHIIICCQILSNYLNDKVASNFFKLGLKQLCKKFLDELLKVERKDFDKCFEKTEEASIVIYNTQENFYKIISEVPVYDMDNLITIWNAYQKDKSSIEGICKKILR